MKCPFCGHENTRVIDSRPADENNSIRRRRVCDECEKRFTTYEQLAAVGPNGEIIMDYSIHDAIEAGFDKIDGRSFACLS